MRPLATTFLMLMSLFTALRLVNAHAAPESVTLPTLTVMQTVNCVKKQNSCCRCKNNPARKRR